MTENFVIQRFIVIVVDEIYKILKAWDILS